MLKKQILNGLALVAQVCLVKFVIWRLLFCLIFFVYLKHSGEYNHLVPLIWFVYKYVFVFIAVFWCFFFANRTATIMGSCQTLQNQHATTVVDG